MTGFPWGGLATEIALCTLGLVMLVIEAIVTDRRKKHYLAYVALVGLLACLVPAAGVFAGSTSESLFGGLYVSDNFHLFFRLFALIQSALVLLLSLDYLEHIRVDRGIYFTLIVFGALAMVLLAGANDLVMIYLTIEYLSITSYILAGFLMGRDKADEAESKRSSEASLKYLIFGSVASAVMLYGFSLMYGLTGSTKVADIAIVFQGAGNEYVKLTAIAMVLVGLGFKIGAAPFHQWAPDVYEGSPTPVAAFLAVGSKAAALALLARLFVLGLGGFDQAWAPLLAIIATATMFVGNLVAILQSNIKRMLGYSSVAHAGYMLVGVIAWRQPEQFGGTNLLSGIEALLVYLVAYLFMTLGAFAVAIWYQRSTGSERIDDYAGLGRRVPWVAFCMTIFMLSLTGIPPTGGFVGKLFLMLAAVAGSGYWWLGLMLVINSTISLFYYMNVARVMWLLPADPNLKIRPALFTPAVILLCAVVTLLMGVAFGPILEMVREPMQAFLPVMTQ